MVLDIPPPRTIVTALEVFQNRLFVSAHIYGGSPNDCVGSIPVYMSNDGVTFQPTTGIAECVTIRELIANEKGLFAFGHYSQYLSNSKDTPRVYRWETSTNSWTLIADEMINMKQELVAHRVRTYQGFFYTFKISGQSSEPGLYRSPDGVNWSLVEEMSAPDISAIMIKDGTLYIGTQEDSLGVAHIYSAKL